MTSICPGGGPSQVIPGFQVGQAISLTAIEGFIGAILADPVAAAALAPIVVGAVISLPPFCAADPPSDPGLTATDVTDAINFLNPSVSLPAQAKFEQWFEAQYWYKACECVTGPTPAAPAPSVPATPLGNSQGLPSAAASTPCWSTSGVFSVPASVTTGIDISSSMLPATPQQTVASPCSSGLPHGVYTIPTGANTFKLSAQIDTAIVSVSEDLTICFYTSTGAAVGTAAFAPTVSPSTAPQVSISIPSTATAWQLWISPGDSIAHTFTVTASFFCSGSSPSGVQSSCCPPDPTLTSYLQQILGLLTSIYQGSPGSIGSYAITATHVALSGSGNFALSPGVIAAQVTCTTIPSSYGFDVGSPTRYFDLGFITPAVATTPYSNHRIEFATQLYQLPSLSSEIYYTLGPGIVATITELTAGP